MSQQNIETVRATLDAFNRHGVEAALAYFDPEIEWFGPPDWLEASVYKGHDGIREIAAVWTDNFDDYHLDLEKAIDAGDRVIALVYQRARIKRGGELIQQQIGYDWEVRGGKGVRVQVYFSWDEALRTVGLSE
jgi:ketosteroid isomerase-like protein